MAVIGSLIISMKADTAQLAKGLAKGQAMVGSFTAKVEQSGRAMQALFAGAAAYGIGAALTKSVTLASDLVETTSKLESTFGPAAALVVKEADRMNEAFGTSKAQFMDANAVLGGLFKNLGYGAQDAAKLSIAMTKLADDVSSRFNITFEEAFAKIRAGISGESEPLKALGVLIDENTVKAEAMAKGFGKAGQELTQSQKVQARLSIITRQLNDAVGDHAKTANEVAGATREMTGRIEEFMRQIGEGLLPVVKAFLGEVNLGVTAMTLYWAEASKGVLDWGQSTVTAVDASAQSVGVLQRSLMTLADIWQAVGLGFQYVQSWITSGLAKIVSGLSWVVKGILKVAEVLNGSKSDFADFGNVLATYSEDLTRLSGDQMAQFQKDLAKPSASDAIAKSFEAARKQIDEARKGIGGLGVDVTKLTPAAGPAPAATAPKFASAMAEGSKEATNAILRSRFGAGLAAKQPEEETAKNTKTMVGLLGQIYQAVADTGIGAEVGGALAGYF